jgi:hypothetical protein
MEVTSEADDDWLSDILNTFGHKVSMNHRGSKVSYANRRKEDDIFESVARTAINAKITELLVEARTNQINKDLQGYPYSMPMKSMRSRNTAFKLYAVKFFNGEIGKRKERQLAQLQASQPKNLNESEM